MYKYIIYFIDEDGILTEEKSYTDINKAYEALEKDYNLVDYILAIVK